LNAYVRQNQHRWKQSLGENLCGVLEDAAALLELAWNLDIKHPESYPFNTSYAFGEIAERIREAQRGESKKKSKWSNPMPQPRSPRRFADLVDEKILRSLYEEQNAGSYLEALKCAASADKAAHFVFHKILKLVEPTYVRGHFGDGVQPKPRVQFLHRNLLEIAGLLNLSILVHKGIVEFMDDLCPCGKAHRVDAIRKLRKRFKHRRSNTHR
jgi:hypothetical protein